MQEQDDTPQAPSSAWSVVDGITRRRLIVTASAAAGVAAVAADHGVTSLTGVEHVAEWNSITDADVTFDVVRDEDAMLLRFRIYNMAIFKPVTGEAYLRTIAPTRPRVLVVDFPPQSIGEQAVDTISPSSTSYDPVPNQDITGNRARAFVTNIPTRLAFEIPTRFATLRPALKTANGVPGLLDWRLFDQLTTAGITSNAYSGPAPFETSIGAPYGMALSPTAVDGWKHSVTPVTKDGRTELWQTRLAATVDEEGNTIPLAEYPKAAPQVNAVWSNNFSRTADPGNLDTDSHYFDLPLGIDDRWALVRLTSDKVTGGYTPTPAQARRLMLTSGGAWLDLHGSWIPPSENIIPDQPGVDPANGVNVGSWIHQSTQGRDHHVVVTYLGYLLPFGHPAALIKETQRRFEASPTGVPVANLRQREYIVVRRADKTYGDGGGTAFHKYDGRNFPFRHVRINTRTTPNLTFRRYDLADGSDVVSGSAFCLAGGVPFHFSVTAWDWENQPVSFTVPMAFVTNAAAFRPPPSGGNGLHNGSLGNETGMMPLIIDAYNKLPEGDPLRTAKLHDASIAVARSRKPGETSLRFASMSFGLTAPMTTPVDTSFQALDQPRANPTMSSGQARIPAVQAVTPGATSKVWFDDVVVNGTSYVRDGFGGDDGPDARSVFLLVDGQPLTFAGGDAGKNPGVFTPDLSVGGISRNKGVVGGAHALDGSGGVDRFKANDFDPAAFFKDARLLGGLDLASIIKGGPGALGDTPDIQTLNTGDDPTKPTLLTTIDWAPTVVSFPTTSPIFERRGVAGAANATSLRLHASFLTPSDGSPPTSEVTGSLRNFKLNMFGGTPFLILDFREFSFRSRNGAKPTVKCDIQSVVFGGPLTFVNALEDFLSLGDNGPAITLSPTGVTAGVSLALPSIGIGAFSLSNLSFSAAVEIPFSGAPVRVRFGFCSREKPFVIAVMIFAGGGHVALAVGSDGVELLEISLEFGGHIEIDVVVATAAIEIMAGIYLAIGSGDGGPGSQTCELTGFLKAHGELNIGPVGASVTFNMSLTYADSGGQERVYGDVEVEVEVHVAFIGGTVSFSVHKEFAGGEDPTFGDMVSSPDFDRYLAAFA
ncbi:MAG: hypothetical protein NTX33_08600 [Propionibacteriales bacterium]|nr:hypothetical protein [Propionibacteriales bacterium]